MAGILRSGVDGADAVRSHSVGSFDLHEHTPRFSHRQRCSSCLAGAPLRGMIRDLLGAAAAGNLVLISTYRRSCASFSPRPINNEEETERSPAALARLQAKRSSPENPRTEPASISPATPGPHSPRAEKQA